MPADLSLADLQRVFLHATTGGMCSADELARLAADDELTRTALEVVADAPDRDAATGVAVYARMYLARLTDALAQDFPALRAVLGRGEFTDLARRYIIACPPSRPSLRFLGERLEPFLRAHELVGERSWLADLARLEWARADVFDAPDASPLTAEDVRDRGPETLGELVVRLVPASRLIETAFSVDETWRSIVDGDPAAGRPRARRVSLVVWRKGIAACHRRLDADEAAALGATKDGVRLAALCDAIAEGRSNEEASARMFQWLARWIGDELLVKT